MPQLEWSAGGAKIEWVSGNDILWTGSSVGDIVGIPPGWFNIDDVLANNAFRFTQYAAAQASSETVWAYWRYGSNVDLGGGLLPKSHGSANLQLNMTLIQQEADGGAGWARYSPLVEEWGVIQINMVAALQANFALT